MPTPYGSRGGMAFSADELRVLRRALAHALHSDSTPLTDEDVQDCLRLADSVDEAVREGGRLRAFLLADLGRYRAALPGTVAGYLELLQDALAAGYLPSPDDLAALRALRGNPVGAALLNRCQALAEQSLRARLAGRTAQAPAHTAPAPRTRLLALPGGKEERKPEKPAPERPAPQPSVPRPDRPIPTPGEVFPPRRKPTPPPQARAAG
ncbi:hypothetical protein NLX86_30850 [Streptomyces sp. A3M-1-3]|uniref:hypothetical protein n=1 Tax=Streptomyces sp. A3M-1-3 TaxID=2962044 RepID=UPI0020B7C88A|nr:hypothetical protein [Streptomyces sp. A3M-1-3]MCP3822325.1 hypothetical protein [Streptomyces sp. A3M-1-3]